jgi:hypothetical protein
LWFKPEQQYDFDASEEQTITWDVNTDISPVNCLKVYILFSAKGDFTDTLY